MIATDVGYPVSLLEASAILNGSRGEAKIVAGGTAVVLMLRQRLITPATLVSLGRVTDPAYRGIEVGEETVRIGGGETLAAIAAHPGVQERLPALATACRSVGNIRIRSRATLCGNLAEADYASDPPAVLVALGARCSAVSVGGSRTIPVAELFRGFYETTIEESEVLAEVTIPVPAPGVGNAYLKYTSRSSEDRPCVGVAAVLAVRRGHVRRVRVAVGAVAAVPQVLPDVLDDAAGRRADEQLYTAIADAYAMRIHALDDDRGSSWYRQRMIAVHVRRALHVAHAAAEASAPENDAP